MATQYDSIGSKYSGFEDLPIASLLQASVREYVGDVTQLRVLDLGCGTGNFSRKLIEWGAREVVGLDNSEAMVDAARRLSDGDKRLDFRVADCSQPLEDLGEFDLVLAIWMLNYASDKKELLTMCQNIFNCMKPGGRCFGNIPVFEFVRLYSGVPKYGVTMDDLGMAGERLKIHVTMHTQDPFSFVALAPDPKDVEECADEAGIRDLHWVPPADPIDPRVDFDEFMQLPYFALYTCSRPKN